MRKKLGKYYKKSKKRQSCLLSNDMENKFKSWRLFVCFQLFLLFLQLSSLGNFFAWNSLVLIMLHHEFSEFRWPRNFLAIYKERLHMIISFLCEILKRWFENNKRQLPAKKLSFVVKAL